MKFVTGTLLLVWPAPSHLTQEESKGGGRWRQDDMLSWQQQQQFNNGTERKVRLATLSHSAALNQSNQQTAFLRHTLPPSSQPHSPPTLRPAISEGSMVRASAFLFRAAFFSARAVSYSSRVSSCMHQGQEKGKNGEGRA